jgi:hypothetical protein
MSILDNNMGILIERLTVHNGQSIGVLEINFRKGSLIQHGYEDVIRHPYQ